MIKLGGPVFVNLSGNPENPTKSVRADEAEVETIDEVRMIVKKHIEKGFKSAYVPMINHNNAKLIAETKAEFEKNNIVLAEADCWENMTDLDPKVRKANREKRLEQLAFADEIGAVCSDGLPGSYCHGEVPSRHTAKNFSEEAFEEAVCTARYFIDTVKPKTSYFCYEVYQFGITDSIDSLERLVKAVDRKQFGIHLDLVNLINCPRLYFDNANLTKEVVRRLGKWIVAAHAKDVLLTNDTLGVDEARPSNITVIFNEVPMGKGGFDWHTGIYELNGLPKDIPLLMEHLDTEREFDAAAASLRKTASEMNIKL